MKKLLAVLVFAVALTPTAAQARVNASCSVSGTTVTATGLPTNRDIWVRYADFSSGLVFNAGRADANGTLVVTVPQPDYPTNFPILYVDFTSKPHGGTWGTQWTTYAECAP